MSYKEIEDHIKNKWEQKNIKKTNLKKGNNNSSVKKYVLDMFPYPSGSGLHVGHWRGYVLSDLMAKINKMEGFEVFHPMGWDSFGLPAENYAIKTGIHPKDSTYKAIETFGNQIEDAGNWYDWDKELATCDPEYYKWNQWIFLQFYKNGYAYKEEAPVNWCPSCETVLANEQVEDGQCERCDSKVEQKELSQWFFKTTAFAEELYNDIDKLDWPDSVKTMQKNWIGKSEGTEFEMGLYNNDNINVINFNVYTTRIDTVFGMTYVVFSPEKILKLINNGDLKLENQNEVLEYCNESINKGDIERGAENKEKTGRKLEGFYSINPFNGEKVQALVSDYVLAGYGSGVVMAVPAHDKRDWQFAKTFGLPIKPVIKPYKKVSFATFYENLTDEDKSFEEADKNELFYKITEIEGYQGTFLLGWVDKENENYLDAWINKYISGACYKDEQIMDSNFNLVDEYIDTPFDKILFNEELFKFQENTAFTNKGIVDID